MRAGRVFVASTLLASLCCVGPLLLAVLGLGSLGLGAFLGRYHWVFLSVAALLLLYAWRLHVREVRTCARECRPVEAKGRNLGLLAAGAFVLLTFLGLNVSLYVGGRAEESPAAPRPPETATATVPVSGMVCYTCGFTIERSLMGRSGLKHASADVRRGTVTVEYDPKQVTLEEIISAINRTGYRARMPAASS